MRHGWPQWGKVAIWSAALGCTLTIGLSRVYLGVHYPTDVLGGYAAGIVWTMLIRLARHVWQARTAAAEKVQPTRG
jgi:undecaprenyl-diphosphatase